MPYEKRAWSGNMFDQFKSAKSIELDARIFFPQLDAPRAWDAVWSWQHWYMRGEKREANVALYMAIDTVLEGLKGNMRNKGICWPGNVITIDAAAHASKVIPAGTKMVKTDCDQ